jgi:hypothetical protein
MTDDHKVCVFINQAAYPFEHSQCAGSDIKARAAIPPDHVLCLQLGHQDSHDVCGCEANRPGAELKVIADDQVVALEDGQHFWSHVDAAHAVTVTIDKREYEFVDQHPTGRTLKERAGIPLTDVLFLDRPHEDEVIANDTRITLKCGECFHSAPPANYGRPELDAAAVGFDRFEVLRQPDGWTFLVIGEYPLPDGFSPSVVRLLVKLPPSFPDAAPDMFWLEPRVRTPSGGAPQGTSVDTALGKPWQRFSWHLLPGAWLPGISTLRDYMRCVRARLEKRN